MKFILGGKILKVFVLYFRDPPKTHEEWLKILQQQESLHATEMLKWQKVLQTAIELLRKVSIICEKIVPNSTNNFELKLNHLIKDEL